MKKLKYQILFAILFMTIGIAAVTSNLVINGNTNIASNLDDFSVYFSNVKVNGVQDLSLVKKSTSLVFNGEFSAVGDNKTITYEVTNASKNYDADIEISCTLSTTYLSISNSFDTSTNLSARSTRTGTLSITLSKSYTGADLTQDISCTINASAVERTSQGSGTVNAPLDKYYIGREISIGEEKFNIISTTDDTVTMLAKYNIGEDYIQSEEPYYVQFSDYIGWTNTPGPKEIDIQYVDGETKTLLNNYVSYLNREYNAGATGDLISLKELEKLGCTISDDYSTTWEEICMNSPYKSWLINNQWWWTRSASSENDDNVWFVSSSGDLDIIYYDGDNGVRPTITISRETVDMLTTEYPIGKEIAIGDEKFNVISNNGTTVSLLAQYNIGPDYRQSSEQNYVRFADTDGWENEPRPKEIDIWAWSTYISDYVGSYVSLLERDYNLDVSGNLITLNELKILGCTIHDDYSYGVEYGILTCANSAYKEWLVNNQEWWTRSSSAEGCEFIWIVNIDGGLSDLIFDSSSGVRPVITISIDTLKNLN